MSGHHEDDLDRDLARLLADEHAKHGTSPEAFRFCSCSCCLERGRQLTAFMGTLMAMVEGRLP